MLAFGSGHRDGTNSCLLYGLSKGSKSVVKVNSGLDERVEVDGGV